MCLVLCSLVPIKALGAEYYVRQGASGNGSDWNNAFGSLPAELVRGATYFVADGSYGSYTFAAPLSGVQRIIIKKAIDNARCEQIGKTTAECHGTAVGWQDSYGVGEALFTGNLYFYGSGGSGGYYTMDGNTAPAPFGAGPYGFQVQGVMYVGNFSQPTLSDFVFRAIDVNPAGIPIGRGFRVVQVNNILIQYCRMRNVDEDTLYTNTVTNLILEYSHLGPRLDTGSGAHGDAGELRATADAVVRYNTVDWDGQHWFFTTPSHGRWDIYGNIQYGGPIRGKAMQSHANLLALELHYYNNSIYNLHWGVMMDGVQTGDVRNNVFHNITAAFAGAWNGLAHDYNWYDTVIPSQGELHEQRGSDPYVDPVRCDFRLRQPIPGQLLSTTYNNDLLGNIRGEDSVWDRGALEYRFAPRDLKAKVK